MKAQCMHSAKCTVYDNKPIVSLLRHKTKQKPGIEQVQACTR